MEEQNSWFIWEKEEADIKDLNDIIDAFKFTADENTGIAEIEFAFARIFKPVFNLLRNLL